MAIFEYTSLSNAGRKTKFFLTADSIEDAKTILELKKVVVFQISKIYKKPAHLTKKEVLDFFYQLENLLTAGLPLYESLIILAENNEKRKIKLLIFDLSEKLKTGYSLSFAMKEHPKTFDLISLAMIENAQKSGNLPNSLKEIIKILKTSIDLKKRLVSAFTYPVILILFCLVVLNFLLFFTIPTLSDLFEDRALHPFTKMVFALSKIVIKGKFFIILAVLLLGIIILIAVFYKPLQKKIAIKTLKLPIIKTFLIKVALIRFSISLANLLKGGLSYIQAFSLAIDVLNHGLLQKELLPLQDELIEGKHLSQLLKNSEYIPSLVSKMLSIAEETSNMPKMLINISASYAPTAILRLRKTLSTSRFSSDTSSRTVFPSSIVATGSTNRVAPVFETS
ncbi:MAG: Type II secretion system protein F [Candidatus Anoxychlamydiales bacterium]|nr:Type II secretion system protein F [Candidatus Anoxychlamydiales bacterium]